MRYLSTLRTLAGSAIAVAAALWLAPQPAAAQELKIGYSMAMTAGLELRNLRQRVGRLTGVEAHPDEAVSLLALEHRRPRLHWNGGVRRLRDADARAGGVVAPRMIGTDQAIVGDPSKR
jgi:hypothetical protein